MSRRNVLRLGEHIAHHSVSKPFVLTSPQLRPTQHVLSCFQWTSHSRRSRSTDLRQGQATWDVLADGRESVLCSIPREFYQQKSTFGFSRKEFVLFINAVLKRVTAKASTRQTALFLRNYKDWTVDTMSVPISLRRYMQSDIERDKREGLDWTQAGNHEVHDTAELMNLTGIAQFKIVLQPEGPPSDPIMRLQLGFYFLEVAVYLGHIGAATALLSLTKDPIVKGFMVDHPLVVSTVVSEDMIEEIAQNDPAGFWPATAAYIEKDYYEPIKLKKQTVKQLAWAIQVLQHAVEDLAPGTDQGSTPPWERVENPSKLLQALVDHCLSNALVIPGYSRTELVACKEQCLKELARYNDPVAAYHLAIRDEDFRSPAWQRLMICAASDGNPDACWLLAIFHLREDGFLPFTGTVKQFSTTDLGRAYAELAIYASIKKPQALINRTVAYAAICKLHGDYNRGSDMIAAALELVAQTPSFPAHEIKALGLHQKSYKSGTDSGAFTEERCKDITNKPFLDPDQITRVALQSLT